MASVGGISCSSVRGSLPAMREESHVWRTPGINGYGIALVGAGDSKADLVAVFYSSNLGVNVWAASLYALQGTIGEVTNDHGDSYASCYFAKVGNVKKEAARIPGSSVTQRGEIAIEVIIL